MADMHNSLLAAVGILSGVVNIIASFPYVIDIFRGKTKPERAMWWIYFVLFGFGFVAQLQAGARWSLVFAGQIVLSAGLIAVLSIKYGYGHFARRDYVAIGVAVVGLVMWWLFRNPLIGVVMVIIIDLAGFWLTLVKTWHAPYTETLISWEISGLASVLGVLAVGSMNVTQLAYPVYSVIGTVGISAMMIYRRRLVADTAKN